MNEKYLPQKNEYLLNYKSCGIYILNSKLEMSVFVDPKMQVMIRMKGGKENENVNILACVAHTVGDVICKILL